MPQYVFEKVLDNSTTCDFFYHMNEAPRVGEIITDKDGVKWKRIFTKPQASIDTKIDPFSEKDYVKATAKGSGTVGDLFDRAKEMSLKRTDKAGFDPIKQQYYKNYSKRRHGKKHPQQKREESSKILSKSGIKVDWGNDD